ncbi:cAMP-responsive element modulator isoform X2 [Festucalex cinctus]
MDDSFSDSVVDEEEHPDGASSLQVLTLQEDDDSDGDLCGRRLMPSMHLAYMKELDELSSHPDDCEIDDDVKEEEHDSTSLAPTSYYARSGQYAAISRSAAAASPGGAHQYYLHAGQMIIQAATGDIPACQLRSPTSGLAHSIVLAAASPSATHSPLSHHTEEVTRKREVRLMKNREAARECRRKKKEYVKCLENRVAVLENQNKTLIEELKALKDIYCHKGE